MSKKELITTYKPSEVITRLTEIIEANDKIIKSGNLPVSVSLMGSHGIGKSTICKEVSENLSRGFFKLNLAQLQEPAELHGYYAKEFKVIKMEKKR